MNEETPEAERAREAAETRRAAEQRPDESAEVSELARHGDPSRAAPASSATTPLEERLRAEHDRSQVVWVRPTELLPSASGRIIGRGIDLRAELARRAEERRHTSTQATPVTRPGVRARAQGLAPLSAFGQSPTHEHSVSRDPLRRL
ncbi:hypothetical protein [Microbacterium sp. NPDC076895]|uniref:hypothetical protein n=1 Tax=Microbacterium sp. NPDC076895 TaxID=3154957 RepID=UPI00342B9BFA